MKQFVSKIIEVVQQFSQECNDLNTQLETVDDSSSPAAIRSWMRDDDVNIDEELNPEPLVESTDEPIIEGTDGMTQLDAGHTSDGVSATTPETLEEIRDKFILNYNNSLRDIFKYLNFSLLSGEYITNDAIEEHLNEVEEKILEFLNSSVYYSSFLQTRINEYSSIVKLGCSGYNVFIKYIKNSYTEDKIDSFFSYNPKIKKELGRALFDEEIEKLLHYFGSNIDLSSYDHFFSGDDVQFEKLFKIEKNLEELELSEFDSITKIIKLKIAFLEHKWKARKQKENPDYIYYFLDGHLHKLEDYTSTNKKLSDWKKIIDSHYEIYISNWKSETLNYVKAFKTKPLNELAFLELHQLIRYFKDVKKNYEKVKEISTFLASSTLPPACYYDSYAKMISTNYALNNAFSSYLEDAKDVDSIRKEYDRTQSLLSEGVNNFFLEYKYLHAIINVLYKQFEKSDIDNIDFLEKYETLIVTECREKFEEYHSRKEWSKNNSNYIFMLPFSESVVDLEDQKFEELDTIFIASSFVLPAVNNHIDIQYSKLYQKYKSLLFQIETLKRIKSDLKEIKELKKDIEKKDYKSMEIIGIFTAIITFVLSSIPAYKFVDNISEAIIFMFTLASALGIFVVLILFATRGFIKNVVGYFYVGALILISIVGYVVLVRLEKADDVIKSEIQPKIDSLVVNRIDSIIFARQKINPKAVKVSREEKK